MAWVATKKIETAKFILEPGMAVPPHFTANWIIRYINKKYGEGSIIWQSYDGKESSDATMALSRLKEENRRLEQENKQLKARLSALDKASKQAA